MRAGLFKGFCGALLMNILGTPAFADSYNGVVLQGLDKVTAKVERLEAPVGTFIRFGNLEIVARQCDKRPPEEPPESAAFLDITEAKPGETPVPVFRGWMFASSPALNPLEHPVYDVWVLDCKNMEANSFDNSSSEGSQ